MKIKIVPYSKRIIGLIKKGGELMIDNKILNALLSYFSKLSEKQKFIIFRDMLMGIGATVMIIGLDLSREAAHH